MLRNAMIVFNAYIYVPKFTKLHPSNGYIDGSCNYFERGGDKCSFYLQITPKFQEHTTYM
jgi:hypothetical protein